MVHDVIIVGVGAMGSAAALHLARRGLRVLGLERFDIPNSMGSSHGINRIIRRTYYEHPAYVPLLARAYVLWRELEAGFNERLLYVTGGIDAGPAGGPIFEGSLAACRSYGLAHEVLDARRLAERFPGYRLANDTMAVFQPDAGFVMSERAIVAHTVAAQSAGADIRARERVLDWSVRPGGVEVRTTRGVHHAGRLVISAGAWLDTLVPEMRGHAVPERQVLGWFLPSDPALFAKERFPVFNITVEEGDFYGFPLHEVPGFKVARHHHREEVVDAETYDREPNAADEAVMRRFVRRYFPAANGPVMALKTCLFTNTADEHFVIGPLPGADSVLVVSPCSGHGFKFSPVIGEMVADLVTSGTTALDIGFLDIARLGLAA